jgi:hypothetical protein
MRFNHNWNAFWLPYPMKNSLLLFMCFPVIVVAQSMAKPRIHQQNADSIVAFFLGTEIFQQYVALDDKKSAVVMSNTHFFQYSFQHPKFSPETFVIAFTLDSTGQFVLGKETHGLISISSVSDSTWITGPQALALARDQARRIKKRSLRLVWDHTSVSYQLFETTHDYRDINPGNLVWQIDGEVLFRGDRYSGTFEIDVVTGKLIRRFAIPWD